ncbi:Hypothetical Protein FCC1311_003612 [Hondaea fermentalgiana]|uniref:Glutaredoxin domain-containing protein n=1 Tax=Hondaea fermentalgiana TaxID=2315210 RepID=A0A2R5G6R9_9STRA|nr:Hypothetical Protein FCC1311_003612 [Hondaea fermentalgiana]|eukprot:GBG24143.1 Hypothetical Protein FCC1311_003612 [Hondaea fermentalgiana]
MGQVTIFEKEDCVYCKRVLAMLEKFRGCVLQEIADTRPGTPAEITIKTVDCGKETAYAAFCVRRTGTFTVPHVFFNEEYVGDATKFMKLDATCEGGYNVLRHQLLELALKPSPTPAFPPPPDASLMKVTDGLAFSAQPTARQLEALKSFGVASVLNILRPDAGAYSPKEEPICTSSGIAYAEFPIYALTEPSLLKALEKLSEMSRPVLVHDDVGLRAGMLVLLAAANEMLLANAAQSIPAVTLLKWAKGLGLDLEPHATVIQTVLAQLPLSQAKSLQNETTSASSSTTTAAAAAAAAAAMGTSQSIA